MRLFTSKLVQYLNDLASGHGENRRGQDLVAELPGADVGDLLRRRRISARWVWRSKELFLLAEIDEHPYPAELAAALSMPKATVTLYLKRLEAAGFVQREIDPVRSTAPSTAAHRRRAPGRRATGWRCCPTSSTSALAASPPRSKRNSRTCSKKSPTDGLV